MDHLSDEQLDSIAFDQTPGHLPPKVITIGLGGAPAMMGDFLTQSWPALRLFANAAAAGHGASYNEHGFSYDSDDQDPGDEPFGGVVITTPFDEAVAGRDAFQRLMRRFLAAAIDAARAQGDPAAAEPWWPEFERNAAAV